MSTTMFDELQSGTAPPWLPITVDQMQQMIRGGILHDGDPVELIDGLLVRKDRSARGENLMGRNPRHALLIKRLSRLLSAGCDAVGWHVQVQLPLTLNAINAPEPDLAIVRGSEEDFTDHHPGPADVILVIEVADSSVGVDRTTKQRLYATANVPRYWLVNVPENQVEWYEQPDTNAGRYTQQTIFKPSETIVWALSESQRLEINVSDLLR